MTKAALSQQDILDGNLARASESNTEANLILVHRYRPAKMIFKQQFLVRGLLRSEFDRLLS